MRGTLVTTYLDILGVFLIALFAFSVWPPACLLVVGVAALMMSWRHSRPGAEE